MDIDHNLWKIFDGVIGDDFSDVEVTIDNYPEVFDKKFQNTLDVVNKIPNLSDKMTDEIKEELRQECYKRYINKCSYQSPKIVSLVDSEHKEWLEKKYSSIKWNQWEFYSTFLKDEKKFNDNNIDAIGKLADQIIDRFEDPKREENIKVKGLLMGEVQSGKTGSFMAVLHKAIDVGWRFLIILSGISNDLRFQTQQRINYDLVGYTLSERADHQNYGIRKLLREYNAFEFVPLTTLQQDFSKTQSSKILTGSPNHVYVLVCKKNAKILENLLGWLGGDRKEIAEKIPCLIIDDEADQASINTKKDLEDYTSVNGAIRNLLNYFSKSAYLAVTATPYANIFINPYTLGSSDEPYLPDLFPNNFIFIKPSPIGYTGVKDLFGSDEDKIKEQVVITIEQNDEEIFKKPLKKDDEINYIPPSLESALRYFFCCCVFKEITIDSHVSMLANIDFRKDHHRTITDLIKEFYESEFNAIKLEQGLSIEELQINHRYNDYKKIWEQGVFSKSSEIDGVKSDTFESLSNIEFISIWKDHLCKTLEKIRIETINSNYKGEKLADIYEKFNNSKIILVGGNALSRGITIEGLCVTYLARNSGAIDTLLQMGRFFGYKGSDIKIMKIWLTQNIKEKFEDAASAQQEFVEQVKIMNDHNQTPSSFGFKLPKAPAYLKLRIAARNKMYHSSTLTLDVNIAGHPLQSSKLPLDVSCLKKNKEIVSAFLQDLNKNYDMFPKTSEKFEDIYWKNVDSSKIAKLIADFNAFGWGDINRADIAAFIEEKLSSEKWIVSVISNNEQKHDKYDLFELGRKVVAVPSKVYIKKMADGERQFIYFSNGSIMRGSDLLRRLTVQEKEQLIAISEEKQLLNNDVVRNKPMLNLSPQLLIYSVKPNFYKDAVVESDYMNLICGLVIAIPCSKDLKRTELKLQYDVNEIFLQNLNSDLGY